jgi:hypothetical protein
MQLNNVFGTNNFKTINVNDFIVVATNFIKTKAIVVQS